MFSPKSAFAAKTSFTSWLLDCCCYFLLLFITRNGFSVIRNQFLRIAKENIDFAYRMILYKTNDQ